MSQLIQPILDGFVALLQQMEFTADPAFASVGYAWTGLLINAPAAWAMPGRTAFPDRGDGTLRQQIHSVTIRLGITGSDPEELTKRALRYVQAVDAAIQAMPNTLWGNAIRVLRVFVVEHDYGVMWKNAGTVAFWPDIHLEVEVEELS
jgi:hypothetical protein